MEVVSSEGLSDQWLPEQSAALVTDPPVLPGAALDAGHLGKHSLLRGPRKEPSPFEKPAQMDRKPNAKLSPGIKLIGF